MRLPGHHSTWEVRSTTSRSGSGSVTKVKAIPPADRPRIFDRFARASGGRRSNEGAGLDLAIVAAIAEGHGGSVSFVEPWEGGNLFIMTIPQRGVDGE